MSNFKIVNVKKGYQTVSALLLLNGTINQNLEITYEQLNGTSIEIKMGRLLLILLLFFQSVNIFR